ncbi:MAG: hypothetical protein ABUL60_26420 [Myxococcales bacterium]
MRRAYAGLLLALSGCDPTRGLADTADAALPNEKRYFDGKGSRLVEGPWNRVVVDLDVDTLYHVGARRLDDEQPTFHLFGADAQTGCEVAPNAGTWLMGKPESAPFRLLPFLEDIDERGRGRLRFTTLDCQIQDLVVEDAGRPYPRLYDHGFLVPTKQGYTFADPWSGESHEVASNLQQVLIWQDIVLLWADDELKSFSEDFTPGDTWGNLPTGALSVFDAFLVEDADGLHRVTVDHDTLEITAEDVLPGACGLQQSPLTFVDEKGAWAVIQQPCGNPKPSLVHLNGTTFETLDAFELPFEADSRHTRALLTGPKANGESLPFAAAFLTDVGDDGMGTAWVWHSDQPAPIQIGEHASLDSVVLEGFLSPWAGQAQINYQPLGDYQVHDWIHFNWDATTDTVAKHIVRNSSSGELLVNFDGVAGDLPVFDADSYRVVAQGVPPYAGAVTSYVGERHYARVDQFDGTSGRLLLGIDAKDPSRWDAVASGVQPDSPRFSWFMPALLFIEDWDPDRKTGSLVAYNYDLDARDTIAEGVSSFDLTSYPWDGVVYSVPEGKQRGIWFSKAK